MKVFVAGASGAIGQPGPTNTDMNPEQSDWGKATLPYLALGRYAQPDEVANFVAFLAGPEASNITGASLAVGSGYTA
jgi:3-oxoacyl-[acyl-carrier protein] reductase